jgi:hypothetical protein
MPEENKPIEDESGTGFFPLDWLLAQFKSALLTLWDMFKDLLIFIVDTLMTAGMLLLEGFSSALELINLSSYITSMPSEVQYVMSVTGLGSALGIVMTAGAARLLMQLIPFVRLGS